MDTNHNNRPAIRLEDPGIHMACCGPNTWKTMQGSTTVFINGKPAVRMGDQTRHCGGIGKMIEGSADVIIGGPPGMGSASGGAPPAGVPGGAGVQGGGATNGAGAGGGGTNGGASGSGSHSSSSSSSSASGGGGAGTGEGHRQSPDQTLGAGGGADAAKADPEHVFVIHAELKSPGGQPLANEQVIIVKHGTTEQVAGPFTLDDQGRLGAVMPENGDYDIHILDDEGEHHAPIGHFADAIDGLHLQFELPSGGVPKAGTMVKIEGNGVSDMMPLEEGGGLQWQVAPGAYDITIGAQTFRAHSMNAGVMAQAGGAQPYSFALEADVDDSQHERARADRYSPSDSDAEEVV